MTRDAIYVERRVEAPIEMLWDRTQDPEAHERWDLRFSDIEYADETTEERRQFTYRGWFEVEYEHCRELRPDDAPSGWEAPG